MRRRTPTNGSKLAVLIFLAATPFVGRVARPTAVVANQTSGDPPAGTFVDVTGSCGIGTIIPTGQRDDWGHGCALVDYDGDTDLDLYVAMDDGQTNLLYENNGAAFFVDVAAERGVASLRDARGVVWADYDNDGDQDAFVANHMGRNILYRNDGTGNFTDVAGAAGVDANTRSHSACWGDIDNDGYLDLFVANYGTLFDPRPNLLYRNNGDGTFTEIAASAGVDRPDVPTLACTWIDYDNDNDLDLYLANDKTRGNLLYRNDGTGNFTDVSQAAGADLQFNAMGIAVGDYDHNGYFDMYVTNTAEGNALLRNNGNGTFTNVANGLGIAVNRIGWGCAFLDYNNDGFEDLYIVNWQLFAPDVEAGNVFFRNNGNATFTNVTSALGVGDEGSAYALTVGDYNDDGFVDMFINNQNYASVFYENVPTSNNWLKIKARGIVSNRDGIGAKVRVTAAALVQLKDVRSGSSYLSQLSPELEFGLGAFTVADEIEVTWPSGTVDVFTDVAVNQYLVVEEGGGLHDVPVFITSFAVTAARANLTLNWNVHGDEDVAGFHVYRRDVDHGTTRLLTAGGVLAPDVTTYVDDTANPGVSYEYQLAVVLADGSQVLSQPQRATAPRYALTLEQNYPNPFNPSTRIRFALPNASQVHVAVYDASGRHVATLLDEWRAAGYGETSWRGIDDSGQPVSSGIYFYRLTADDHVLTKKMILIK